MSGLLPVFTRVKAFLNYIFSGRNAQKRIASLEIDGCDVTADYWKLTPDGRLLNDNEADLYLSDNEGNYLDENGNIVKTKEEAFKIIDTETSSVSQALVQYVGMDRAAEMLGVSPGNMGNYDPQTLKDVLGVSQQDIKHMNITFDTLSTSEKQKLMGELLMKKGAGQSWNNKDEWHGDSIAEFEITDNWDGYSIGFDKTMTNGEYDKFVVDIEHTRDALSYLGSTGDITSRKKYNALDSSVYYKKDLDGNILEKFDIDKVQTVDNSFYNGASQPTGYRYPFGGIQGNTIKAGSPFFTMYGASSSNFEKMTFLLKNGLTIDGGSFDSTGNWSGFESSNRDGAWKQHQMTPKNSTVNLTYSDGCIVNTDENTSTINQYLNNWGLYSQFNMGTVINEDWKAFNGYY